MSASLKPRGLRPYLTVTSVADVWAGMEAGTITEDDDFELIEGEVIPRMASESSPHVLIKNRLGTFLGRALSMDSHLVTVDSTFVLSDRTMVEPDVLVLPFTRDPLALRGPDILLACEVAVSSYDYDLERKARLYARYGVAEYWVIDAIARRTHVHLDPGDDGYGSVGVFDDAAVLAPTRLPGVSFRLTDLG